MTGTLNRYLIIEFLKTLAMMFCILMGIIYLFDTIELLRRAAKQDGVSFFTVLQMAFFKLPDAGQTVLPFVFLFATLQAFWTLNKRSELVVIRSFGLSAWQFIGPILLTGLVLGIIHLTALSPVYSKMLSHFQALEIKHLGETRNIVSVARTGIWLRMKDSDTGGDVIINAKDINLKDRTLIQASATFFDDAFSPIKQIYSDTVRLDPNQWVFEDTTLYSDTMTPQAENDVIFTTRMSIADLEKSFIDPEQVSIWSMPDYIAQLQNAGINTLPVRMHFQSSLSQPLFFAAIILLAASFSLGRSRMRNTLFIVMVSILCAFGLFFLSSFLRALGASEQLPIVIAAWTPAILTALIAVNILILTEDG